MYSVGKLFSFLPLHRPARQTQQFHIQPHGQGRLLPALLEHIARITVLHPPAKIERLRIRAPMSFSKNFRIHLTWLSPILAAGTHCCLHDHIIPQIKTKKPPSLGASLFLLRHNLRFQQAGSASGIRLGQIHIGCEPPFPRQFRNGRHRFPADPRRLADRDEFVAARPRKRDSNHRAKGRQPK